MNLLERSLIKNTIHLFSQIDEITNLRNLLKTNDIHSALDIGLGSGITATSFAKQFSLQVSGIDIQDDRWENYKNVPLIVYNGEDMPIPTKSIPICLIAFVLHHCSNKSQVLAEVQRITRNYIIILEEVVDNPFQKYLMILYDKIINLIIFKHFISSPDFMSQAHLNNLFQNAHLKILEKKTIQKKAFIHRIVYILQPID